MAIVHLDASFPWEPEVFALSDAAFRLHVAAMFWCRRHSTGGVVGVSDLRQIWLWTGRGRPSAQRLVEELVFSGLWTVNTTQDAAKTQPNNSQWCIEMYLATNPSKEQLTQQREGNAARQRAFRERQTTGEPGVAEGNRNAVTPEEVLTSDYRVYVEDSISSKEQTTTTLVPRNTERPELLELCNHLADRIEGNGSKRPNITKRWLDAARLLIDADGRTVEQVHTCIDWCQQDEFWRANILSMAKLRQQYDRLRLAAQRPQRGAPRRSTTDERVEQTLELARELAELGVQAPRLELE